MRRAWHFLALLVAAGCELKGHSAGTQLAQGRDIEAPHIVWAGERPLVLFDRTTEAKTDLHVLSFDGTSPELVWENISGITTWLSASGYLVNESSQYLSLFSLASPTLLRSMVGTIDGLQGDELLYYQGGGTSTISYLVHLPLGEFRELGRLAQRWLAPDGRLYYLSNTGIFRSLKASDSAPETVDRLASQFGVASDQRHAVIRERPEDITTVPPETRDRLVELPSRRELALLPLADRQCAACVSWLGFSPDNRSFYYAENSRAEASVVYQLDVEALEVAWAATRPGTFTGTLLWSPSGDRGLLGDQPCSSKETGCRPLYRSVMLPGPTIEPLSTTVAGARFSPDGRYLLFEDALSGGRLMVASVDALSPEPLAGAAVLSPAGSQLEGSRFEADTNTVVFWARPMGGKTSINYMHTANRGNLYAASAPDFVVRRLAESVDRVAIGRGHALALVRLSPQDLTGDLVLYDLRSGHEEILASPVSAFWVSADCPLAGSPPLGQKWRGTITRATEIGPGCPDRSSLLLTFVVRGRVKSDKDGLWSLALRL